MGGYKTHKYYDDRGRETMLVDTAGFVTVTAYDAQDNKVRVASYKTAANVDSLSANARVNQLDGDIGTELRAVYNNENLMIAEYSPSLYWTDASLSGSGELINVRTRYTYDAAGNITSTIKNGALKADGTELAAANFTAQVLSEIFYDSLNQAIGTGTTNANGENIFTHTTYDDNGNVTESRVFFTPISDADLVKWREGTGSPLPAADSTKDMYTVFRYNDISQLERTVELLGDQEFGQTKVNVYGYDAAGNMTYQRSGDLGASGGPKTSDGDLILDANGEAALRVSFYEYDALGREVVSRTAENLNKAFITEYDTRGNKIETRFEFEGGSQSKVEQYVYNENNQLIASNQGDGLWRQFGVDERGNPLVTLLWGIEPNNVGQIAGKASDWLSGGALVSFDVFDARGDVIKHVDEEGGVYKSERDYAGRVTLQKRPDSINGAALSYDGSGNLVTESDQLGNVTTHRYDVNGNRVQTIYPAGNEQRWVYDASGALLETYWYAGGINDLSASPKLIQQRYQYDAFNREIRAQGAAGPLPVTKTYDNLGRITSITSPGDPTGVVTRYYLYDTFDNQVAVKDENGNVTVRRYGDNNKLVQEWVLGTRVTVPDIAYSQDATLSYLTGGTNILTATVGVSIIESELPTTSGRVTRWDGSTQFQAVFDQQAASGGLDSAALLVNSWSYNYLGQMSSKTENGVTTTSRYDNWDRYQGREGESSIWHYDNYGRVITKENSPGSKFTQRFTYDGVGRVATYWDTVTGGFQKIQYDLAGNITREQFWVNIYEGQGFNPETDFDNSNFWKGPQESKANERFASDMTYTYNAEGDLTSWASYSVTGSGTGAAEHQEQYGYDSNRRVA